jgi:hypothetical protein
MTNEQAYFMAKSLSSMARKAISFLSILSFCQYYHYSHQLQKIWNLVTGTMTNVDSSESNSIQLKLTVSDHGEPIIERVFTPVTDRLQPGQSAEFSMQCRQYRNRTSILIVIILFFPWRDLEFDTEQARLLCKKVIVYICKENQLFIL